MKKEDYKQKLYNNLNPDFIKFLKDNKVLDDYINFTIDLNDSPELVISKLIEYSYDNKNSKLLISGAFFWDQTGDLRFWSYLNRKWENL